jgi:hypothetical protein
LRNSIGSRSLFKRLAAISLWSSQNQKRAYWLDWSDRRWESSGIVSESIP